MVLSAGGQSMALQFHLSCKCGAGVWNPNITLDILLPSLKVLGPAGVLEHLIHAGSEAVQRLCTALTKAKLPSDHWAVGGWVGLPSDHGVVGGWVFQSTVSH